MTTDSQSQTAPAVAAPTSAVKIIAESLGFDPRALANSLDPDTLRRTGYPAIREVTADGKTLWKHPEYKPLT